jgi:hypothetical protein
MFYWILFNTYQYYEYELFKIIMTETLRPKHLYRVNILSDRKMF